MAKESYQDFIEELKYKCDIVDIISQYVPVTKKGGRYLCCCPFHNEKTPSFHINQSSGFYHCFGCNLSGDVISFIMEIESFSFIEAVTFLAEKVGVQLPEFKKDVKAQEKKERKDILKQLMLDTARFYRNNLLREGVGDNAREYLSNRGINADVSQRYGLGLSVNYDSLQSHLRIKGYAKQDMIDCGVCYGDKLTDAFANRIIVPIFDALNQVVAFGGRIYQGEQDIAKYKNSTNTILFDKSKILYGINLIKKQKRVAGGFKEIILVEGYMDVIALGCQGINNVVAGLGTAFTEGQGYALKRLADTVYVCYDGDSAGRKAAIKNVDTLEKCGLYVKVVQLDDGKDPDDTINSEGYESFMKRISNALPIIEYKLELIKEVCDLKSVNGRARFASLAMKVVDDIKNQAERAVYKNEVAKISGINVDYLQDESNVIVESVSVQKQKVNIESRDLISARVILKSIINNKEYVDVEKIYKDWFQKDEHIRIFELAKGFERNNVIVGDMYTKIQLQDYENDLDSSKNTTLAELNKLHIEDIVLKNQQLESSYYADCVINLANDYLESKRIQLLNDYNDLSDDNEKKVVLKKIMDIQKRKKSKNIDDKL